MKDLLKTFRHLETRNENISSLLVGRLEDCPKGLHGPVESI